MARRLKGPEPEKKKKGMAVWFKVAIIIAAACCVGTIINQEIKIYQIKQEQAATQKRLEALEKQKVSLEKERKLLDDPKHIERIARDDYNMVGPNEVPLFVVNRDNEKK